MSHLAEIRPNFDYEPPGSLASEARSPPLYPLLPIDSIELGDEPPSLIDGLLCSTGLGVVFGLPKSGKSFLLSDALFHVAMGRSWAGRDVLQGAVAYVSSEGVQGLKHRFVAMREHYGVTGQGVPFAFIPAMPALGTSAEDIERLTSTVQHWLDATGNPPLRAIAIDTLARAMAGADENSSKDMGILTANAEKLAAHFGCIVILVHHAGRSAEGRSRGSNALDGSADVMWHVEKKDGQNRATIVAMKDGEDGIDWTFRLQPFDFAEMGATRAQQAPQSTCTVEIATLPAPAQQAATKAGKRPLPANPKKLLSVVTHAIGQAGEHVKGDMNVPPDVKAVSREMLKRYARIMGYFEDGKTDAVNRANLSRDLKRLDVDGYAGITEGHVWLIQRGS